MNRLILAMVFLALCFTGKATTYTGDVALPDVAALRDFFGKHPGVDSIFGNLVVHANLEDSTDWKPLERIKLVSGQVELKLSVSDTAVFRFGLEQVGTSGTGSLKVHFDNQTLLTVDFPNLREVYAIDWVATAACNFTGAHLLKKVRSITVQVKGSSADSLGFFRGLEELESLRLKGYFTINKGLMPSLVRLDSFSIIDGFVKIDDAWKTSLFPQLNGKLKYLNFNNVFNAIPLYVLSDVHTFIFRKCYGFGYYHYPKLRTVHHFEVRENESRVRTFDSLTVQNGGTFIFENIDLRHEGMGYVSLPDSVETFDVWSANLDPLKVESDSVRYIRNFKLRGGLTVKPGPVMFPNWVGTDSVTLDSVSINTELLSALTRVEHSIDLFKTTWKDPVLLPEVTGMSSGAQVLMDYNTVSNGSEVQVLPKLKTGQLRKVSYLENQSNGYYVFLPVFGQGQNDCGAPEIDSLEFATRSVHDNLNFRCLKRVGSIGHVTARFFPQDPTWFYDFLCPLINQQRVCAPESMAFSHTQTSAPIPLAPLLEQCTGVVGVAKGYDEQSAHWERLQQALREGPVALRIFAMNGQLLWTGSMNHQQWHAYLDHSSGSVLLVVSPEYGSFKIYR